DVMVDDGVGRVPHDPARVLEPIAEIGLLVQRLAAAVQPHGGREAASVTRGGGAEGDVGAEGVRRLAVAGAAGGGAGGAGREGRGGGGPGKRSTMRPPTATTCGSRYGASSAASHPGRGTASSSR